MLRQFFRWFNDYARHQEHIEWQYGGAVEDGSSDSYWYWHYEQCRWCDRKRKVLNSGHCACGGQDGH